MKSAEAVPPSGPAVVVRILADGDDREAVGALVQRGYFAVPGYPHDDEFDVALADIAGRESDSTVVLAELDGTIVGCLTYVADAASPHAEHADPDAATFRYFAVDPAVQGRRVGESMVRWVIDRARADGKRRVRIHTLEMMTGARRLYERLGFVREPQLDEDWDGVTGLAYRFEV